MIKLKVDTVEEAKDVCGLLEVKYGKLYFYRSTVESTYYVYTTKECKDPIYEIEIKNWLNKLPDFYNKLQTIGGCSTSFIKTQIEYHGTEG